MESIFGGNLATGKFAVGSGDSQGHHFDSCAGKVDGPTLTQTYSKTEIAEGSKATDLPSTVVGGKRKRGHFSEDEMLLLSNMSDAVNNVAVALRETGPAYVDGDLYSAVMEMGGYTEDALMAAYTFLLDNKAQAKGFVNMSDGHKSIWLRTFLAKNYFM